MKTKIDFSNKVSLVTGGTRGIGRAIVKLLAYSGSKVIYTGTKDSDIDPVEGAEYWKCDFLDDKSVESFIKRLRKLDSLDIAVNNAGINIIEPIDNISESGWDSVIKVNLTGAMLIIKEVSFLMKKKGKGKILNISSIFGIVSRVKRNAYSASKAGLIGLTRSAALDLAEYGILVNALCPGFTLTDLTMSILSENEIKELSKEVPIGRFADEEEIAKAAVFLCSDLNTYMTGQALVVDGGFVIR
jgi:3-oxoacyl-[acyl-carrier protein] reductase